MTMQNEDNADLPVTPDDTEDEEEDDEVVEDSDDSSDDGDDLGNDTEGGSGADSEDSDEETPDEAVVTAPTGEDLLKLLAGDETAQKMITSSLEAMIAENQRTAVLAADSEEFKKLVADGDYATIGEKIVERTRNQQARETVTDEVLKAQFGPVYTELFAQPEMQSLTAEDREALNPGKFASDAHYVVAINDFIQHRRTEATIEAEVEKRLKAAAEATGNEKVAKAVKGRSLAATPASTGPVAGRATSGELIRRGFAAILDPDGSNDDDDD